MQQHKATSFFKNLFNKALKKKKKASTIIIKQLIGETYLCNDHLSNKILEG